ncbi:acyl-CoA thioesterase II [Parafrankia sp. EUN1f]|uniref:acyl-CoA thioesterase n=1 Tax=Parafrankia sp. EUN1f TaxID=102897 RepID=UPI0001C4751F|nr:thioesterase family protein [Parafrankia sp. EUN1f]EFC79540.1 Acyl-CoA thioesterase-like protein [Parafrankia sp. EUN1f]
MADLTTNTDVLRTAGAVPVGENVDGLGTEAARRRADRRWLGLELLDVADAGPAAAGDSAASLTTRAEVTMEERHLTQLQRMYGGMGLALVGALVEETAARPLRWATTQFVGSPRHGERLDLVAEVLAAGRRTSQVRVTGTVAGRVVLTGLGAAAEANPEIPGGTLPVMPAFPPPEECEPVRLRFPPSTPPGFFGLVEIRQPAGAAEPRLRFWMRFGGRPATRPAMLALVADSVPTMVMGALGNPGSGSSLDNTIRVGSAPDSEWVLVDGIPDQAADGYGHGSVRLWSPDGSLAGVGSQTAALWFHRRG